MLFIAWGLMTGAVIADPCDDYDHAVDKYIQAIRLSGQKVDQATNAHQFADSVNLFASATEELTATLRDLSPQVTSLYQSRGNGPLPGCDRAQEKLVSFAPELNAIGTKFSEQVQKYISDPEVQKAFDRLRKLRFDSSERQELRRNQIFIASQKLIAINNMPGHFRIVEEVQCTERSDTHLNSPTRCRS